MGMWTRAIAGIGLLASMAAAPTQAGAEPPGGCRVDMAAPAVAAAVARLAPDPTYGRSWMLLPAGYNGNFSPCATLSTALVSIVGGTASSPEQALFFHKGGYLGTATARPRSFISLDAAHTTDDTVVLRYMTPGSCDACPDGTFTPVRFHWDGARVDMIGNPPAL